MVLLIGPALARVPTTDPAQTSIVATGLLANVIQDPGYAFVNRHGTGDEHIGVLECGPYISFSHRRNGGAELGNHRDSGVRPLSCTSRSGAALQADVSSKST